MVLGACSCRVFASFLPSSSLSLSLSLFPPPPLFYCQLASGTNGADLQTSQPAFSLAHSPAPLALPVKRSVYILVTCDWWLTVTDATLCLQPLTQFTRSLFADFFLSRVLSLSLSFQGQPLRGWINHIYIYQDNWLHWLVSRSPSRMCLPIGQ